MEPAFDALKLIKWTRGHAQSHENRNPRFWVSRSVGNYGWNFGRPDGAFR